MRSREKGGGGSGWLQVGPDIKGGAGRAKTRGAPQIWWLGGEWMDLEGKAIG